MKKKLQKMDFTGKTIYIGMDVHKKTWYTTIIFGEVKSSKSFSASSQDLYKYLTRSYPGANYKLAYEAGYSGFWIYEELTELGLEVFVANPSDIPTTDKEKRTKTDKIDSKKIAMSLKAGMIKSIFIPSKRQQEDRALLRHRRSMVKDQTRVKNRIKSFCSFEGIQIPDQFSDPGTHWSNKFLSWLEILQFKVESGSFTLESYLKYLRFLRQEILDITKKIRKLSKTEHYEKYCNILLSTPGIGLISAMTLLTEIGKISRFKDLNRLLSYIGIVPTEHSSGEKQKSGSMNKRQNKQLRTIIIEASWIAVRRDPSLANHFNKCLVRMNKQKAIVKIGKKLVSKIFNMWTKEEYYVAGLA